MCLDESIGGIEAWVRNAIDPDATSVGFYVFDEPIGSVVGVGTFVNVLVGFAIGYDRTDIYILNF